MPSIEELKAQLEKEKQLAEEKRLKAEVQQMKNQREHPHLVKFARGLKQAPKAFANYLEKQKLKDEIARLKAKRYTPRPSYRPVRARTYNPYAPRPQYAPYRPRTRYKPLRPARLKPAKPKKDEMDWLMNT